MAALGERAEAAGLLVLAGRAAEHERDVPFGLVVDALDDHVATLRARRVEALGPELGAVLPSAAAPGAAPPAAPAAAERFRYHRALRSLLGLLARERPVALLLDDLHWADEASIELVLHLLRRPPAGALLLALALRPTDPLPRLLDAARSAAHAEHLPVRPLAAAAALGLVGDLPGALRERVVAEAGGNPLFIEELAKAARQPGDALPPPGAACSRSSSSKPGVSALRPRRPARAAPGARRPGGPARAAPASRRPASRRPGPGAAGAPGAA